MELAMIDCAIIGAGPAGLNASLVLGRARRSVALFDNNTNRNRKTQESHGFLTRDGIKPAEFRELSLNELKKYPYVQHFQTTVSNIVKLPNGSFKVTTSDNTIFVAEKVLLATGIQEVFPDIPNVKQCYGKSLFSCPYCDGWELSNKKLLIIAENEDSALHLSKLLYHWSNDLVLATNGTAISSDAMEELARNDITVVNDPIKRINNVDGYLTNVEFESNLKIEISFGFVAPSFIRSNQFAETLGCELQKNGTIVLDDGGRTSVKNLYAAGETAGMSASSLVIAASEGNKAAVAMNGDMAIERF
ncbi:pyridine nucleotide-disulfide oxidoreductase [Siminovitchia terrae]|uniref:NAD(P)/FAD-dependent oxidoreductase n=1 Tax=Siminovitchia terrae TaxID=1914933 RepID=A0A429XCE1_SIMTE|nr:NAD(P)/FAD-dependent oxidoreductase [Siminovitchia terrae]RST60643.1 NAD(P)/FAD-dependent oxidoreductase [Siminovitchia terrae]GIN91229.1 pyridine nucleotide-disulfide oxidoreductase [Siminovitchia terrae]GIN94854.1 pyridine nucleotide-disulfide oxidoreductase [Siminovitchia terrae]